MTKGSNKIREYVEVRPHPTVVRLNDLDNEQADWLTESFVITPDIENHLHALRRLFAGGQGGGVFVIGHYGSGKSHLLAYVCQQLKRGAFIEHGPAVAMVSLVNFSSDNRLEDIVAGALGITVTSGDRRPAWDELAAPRSTGLLLVLDELSEFLRSKGSVHAFNEDIRFLQYMGEWAQDQRLWIVAAMQEGIEHTGELEYSLYRKIKDRYPLRLLLTPAHVQTLISDGILIKKPGYEAAVERLARELGESLPNIALDYSLLRSIYPLHPATLELLEEVRDRFSQARGVVDFVTTRLAGDAARSVEPFLDQPWGSLVTPDAIVDHFRDLLELQPEFLSLAQQVFPWYQRHLAELFERPALRELAERLLKLLVLVYLSPARESLEPKHALAWLMFSVARVDPGRNLAVMERVLSTLATQGRYVNEAGGAYRLNLSDGGGAFLDQRLKQEMEALRGRDELILDTLLPLLPDTGVNPYPLPRDQWQHRRVAWHFHERRYAVWFGEGRPAPCETLGLCIRPPWGERAPAEDVYTLIPAPIEVGEDLLELAALARLTERPSSPELEKRVKQRIEARCPAFEKASRNAWLEANVVTPEGRREAPPRLAGDTTLKAWLDNLCLWMLRRTYPGFERFAPGHGPLPREAWPRFVRFAMEDDIGHADADEYVKLIREAYLVPMGLLRRKGRDYVVPGNLEKQELVGLLTPLLEHSPSPPTVYEHLAEPIYGLVPDQVSALLIMLLLQGEIDIVKSRRSYRETFDTLPNPLSYDRIVPGHALDTQQLHALIQLCEGLDLRPPKQWTVLAQRRHAAQIRKLASERVSTLEPLVTRLRGIEQGRRLLVRVERHIAAWNTLDQGDNALQGLEHFLFAVGSVTSFIGEAHAFEGLGERIQRSLGEIQRYRHLLQHPGLSEEGSAKLSQAMERLGEMPDLARIEELEAWLTQVGRVYATHKVEYQERHDRWWAAERDHPIWTWRAPPLARSRHLGLKETLAALDACRQQAAQLKCRGLVDLDYQPLCSCGFDGERAPLGPVLERFESLKEEVDKQLRLFFQQDSVKARMHDWQRDGLEMQSGTISYLDGDRHYPEVRDVDSLDRYLGGIELVHELDVSTIVELLCARVWEPAALIQAVRAELDRFDGKRLKFRGAPTRNATAESIILWCAEQALRSGTPLPQGLSRDELRAIGKALRAEWVSEAALQRLESLGLDEECVDRVSAWLLNGHLPLPGTVSDRTSVLAAASELLRPSEPRRPEDLANLSETLFQNHGRFKRLARERWLRRLDEVARVEVGPVPELADVLQERLDAQWLLVDCFGVPLLHILGEVVENLFAAWQPSRKSFARVSARTTTDACYRTLLDAGINHAFEKLNVIDELIHGGLTPFADLAALAATELRIVVKPMLARLDPGRPLLLFADHGFRISADGEEYTHGGDSTLERVVPVWYLDCHRTTHQSVRRLLEIVGN